MPEDLRYLTSRVQEPVSQQGRLPNTDTVASLRREDSRNATTIAKWYFDQFKNAVELRRQHAIRWTQTLSIMNGCHYFFIDHYGNYHKLSKQNPDQVWAVVPVLDPFYRWEHGRLSANKLGITASPITGTQAASFYQTALAQDAMTHWIDEVRLPEFHDGFMQNLITYGMVGLYAEKVPFRQQAYLRGFPQSDLFPIPYDARNWEEADGVARAVTVSKDWLEMQDEMFVRRNGFQPPRRMSKLSSSMTVWWNSRFLSFGSNIAPGSKFDGATAIWIWRKPTEINPLGEHLFMIEDELFGYVSGRTPDGGLLALQNGDLPIYPVYYVKKPHDWWGYSFCSGLVPMQLEANRQLSTLIESQQINRGFLGYNSDLVKAADIQSSITGLVPFSAPGPEDRTGPFVTVPPANVGRDIGPMLEIVENYAKKAAAYESEILTGQQEGRTDSAGATQLLNANAQAPLQPVLDRTWRGYAYAYRDVYQHIRAVWPQQKRLQISGQDGFFRSLILDRNQLASSDVVMLTPTPMMVNGRNGAIQLMLSLRQMQGDDGQPIVSAAEVRQSLMMLNMAPLGMKPFDEATQRIRWRVQQLINDGQTPAIPDASQESELSGLLYENHRKAIEIILEAMLNPASAAYSPQVKGALLQELKFHQQHLTQNVREVDNFDTDGMEWTARQTDNALYDAELNPETTAGKFIV